MVESVTLEEYYFRNAIILRESRFINGILTNSEIWYRPYKSELDEPKNLDAASDNFYEHKMFNPSIITQIS